MSAYIKTEPCCSCDAARTERETGAGFCAGHGLNFDECYDWWETRDVDERLAPQAAALIKSVNDHAKRRELAIAWGDGFANMLDLQGKGTEFNCDEFLASCGLPLCEAVLA
jgi:hypothetical protein